MPVAQDAAAPGADASLQQIYSATTLIAVGGDLRTAKELEFGHRAHRVSRTGTRRADTRF